MIVSALPIKSAQKVCAILRALSSHAPMRLTEIAVASALNIKPQLKRYPEISLAFIRQEIFETRERGAAVMLDRIVKRMGGIAVPILSTRREVLGAFSLVRLSERLRERQSMPVAALQREAAQVTRAMEETVHRPTRLRMGGHRAR